MAGRTLRLRTGRVGLCPLPTRRDVMPMYASDSSKLACSLIKPVSGPPLRLSTAKLHLLVKEMGTPLFYFILVFEFPSPSIFLEVRAIKDFGHTQ